MALTLGFLASVVVLLPGLIAIVSINILAGRAGARRADVQLTTVNALVAAVIVSAFAHYLAWLVAAGAIDAGIAIHEAFPVLDFGPALPNPVGALFAAVTGGPALTGPTAGACAALLALEVVAILAFGAGDSFDLLFDRLDWNGQGWVFQHITVPAQNGYAPIGHVFTATMNDGYGVAYKGVVIDARQGANGELIAIALARPERFLYEIGAFPKPSRRLWQRTAASKQETDLATGFRIHRKDYVGGVVHLDAKVISNVVVHNIAKSLLDEITDSVSTETPQ